jgi:WD40 repeat protein
MDFYCVSGSDFDASGATFAVAGCDGEVATISTTTGHRRDRPVTEAHLGGDYGVDVRFSANGKALFVDDQYQGFQVLDPSTLRQRSKPAPPPSGSACSAFSPNRQSLAIGSVDGALVVLDTQRPGTFRQLSAPSTSQCVMLQWLDAKRFVVALSNGEVALWDVAGAAVSRPLPTLPGATAVATLAVSPAGTFVAAEDSVGTIVVWDLARSQRRELVPAGAPDPPSAAVAWSPNGDRLAAFTSDRVMVWDARSFAKVAELRVQSSARHVLAWSPDSAVLAVPDSTVRLLRVADAATVTLAVVDDNGRRTGLVGTAGGLYSGASELSACVVPDGVPVSKRAQRPDLLARFFSGATLDPTP